MAHFPSLEDEILLAQATQDPTQTEWESDGALQSDRFLSGKQMDLAPLIGANSSSGNSISNANQMYPSIQNASVMQWDLPAENINSSISSLPFFTTQNFPNALPDNYPIFPFQTSNISLPGAGNVSIIPETHHIRSANSPIQRESAFDDRLQKYDLLRGDSFSECSDQIDDLECDKLSNMDDRRHPSKNLEAERKRRKKLNDRLFALRSLVPKITKMDRASILGDAIEYVKELQKKAKDLEEELKQTEREDEGKHDSDNTKVSGVVKEEQTGGPGMPVGMKCSFANKNNDPAQMYGELSDDDKCPHMEPQVMVNQVNENEFFLKVICEHKPDGFVRLMEAMDTLQLEVTSANVTTFRNLVLNIFEVKRTNTSTQADRIRELLLEVTRYPNRTGVAGNHENKHSRHLCT